VRDRACAVSGPGCGCVNVRFYWSIKTYGGIESMNLFMAGLGQCSRTSSTARSFETNLMQRLLLKGSVARRGDQRVKRKGDGDS
jgi:hypothetical protein